jgi:hypothetical protein
MCATRQSPKMFLLKSDSFFVTRDFLSYMLGVHRGSITAAAGALQRDGLIQPRDLADCAAR